MIDAAITNLNIRKFDLTSILPDSTILCIGRRRCFTKNTLLLTFNGYPIKIQDITYDTILMGDDSTPRKIKNITTFNDVCYKISNKYNDSYYVNPYHLLCLKYCKEKCLIYKNNIFIVKWFDNTLIKSMSKKFKSKSCAMYFFEKLNENLFIDISVNDFLALPKKIQKRLYGYRKLVDFKSCIQKLNPFNYAYYFLFNFNKFQFLNSHFSISMYKNFSITDFEKYIITNTNDRLDFLNSLYLHSNSQNNQLVLQIPFYYFSRIVFLIHSLNLCIQYTYENNIGIINFKNIQLPIYNLQKITYFKLNIKKQHNMYKFYSITINANNKFLLYNTNVVHNSGKSWLIRDIFYNKKDIPYGIVFSSSEQASPFFSNFIPDTFIYSDFDSDKINKLFIKQAEKISNSREKGIGNNGKTPQNNVFIVLDDMLHNANIWKRDNNMKNIIFNGRHYNILSILTTQYAQAIPTDFRGNMDYVFIFNEPSITNRKKLYEAYASCIPTFDGFCNILDRCTEEHSCLVIKTFTSSNNIEDQVFWYKAENHTDFRVGCSAFWHFHFSNYNLTHDKTNIEQAKQVAKYREKYKNNNKLKYVVNKYDTETDY